MTILTPAMAFSELEKRLQRKLGERDLALAREILNIPRTKVREFVERKVKEVMEA